MTLQYKIQIKLFDTDHDQVILIILLYDIIRKRFYTAYKFFSLKQSNANIQVWRS